MTDSEIFEYKLKLAGTPHPRLNRQSSSLSLTFIEVEELQMDPRVAHLVEDRQRGQEWTRCTSVPCSASDSPPPGRANLRPSWSRVPEEFVAWWGEGEGEVMRRAREEEVEIIGLDLMDVDPW